jgi:hypothetical protein
VYICHDRKAAERNMKKSKKANAKLLVHKHGKYGLCAYIDIDWQYGMRVPFSLPGFCCLVDASCTVAPVPETSQISDIEGSPNPNPTTRVKCGSCWQDSVHGDVQGMRKRLGSRRYSGRLVTWSASSRYW